MSEILKISAREILDSRGNPTVEAEVTLTDGTVAIASVPSGASRGRWEAVELRDTELSRYHKKGTLAAIKNVNEKIFPALVGMDALDIDEIDSVMIALDGMHNKSNLGANAILSVSLAVCRAAAMSLGIPLYRYLGGHLVRRMPIPMMNILNGGVHAGNNLDVQEFMIIPTGAPSFAESVRMCSEVYHTLKNILAAEGLSSAVGDEGGFAPSLKSDTDALGMLTRAIAESGYKTGDDFMLGIDAAASEWWDGKRYIMPKRRKEYTKDELISYYEEISSQYPILSIEDGLGEEDKEGWLRLTERLGDKIMLVGDDLFVTDPTRIEEGVRGRYANSVLIKPNQIGSVTDTHSAVMSAVKGGYKTVMSHRSADTEDSFIADLAVALSVDFIKTGAPARAERTAKYNRLIRIEEEIFTPLYGMD